MVVRVDSIAETGLVAIIFCVCVPWQKSESDIKYQQSEDHDIQSEIEIHLHKVEKGNFWNDVRAPAADDDILLED